MLRIKPGMAAAAMCCFVLLTGCGHKDDTVQYIEGPDVNVTVNDISYDEAMSMIASDRMTMDTYEVMVENDSLSYEQRMRLLWGDEQIDKRAAIYYPGFTIGFDKIDGELYRTFKNEESNITVSESYKWYSSDVIISNSTKSINISASDLFCDNNAHYPYEERLFMMDLTGDGIKELVIRDDINDFQTFPSNVKVYDVNTLDEIIFDKSKCDKYIEDNITVEYSQVGNENKVRYKVTSPNGDKVEGVIELYENPPYSMWKYMVDTPHSDSVIINDNKICVYDILTFTDNHYDACEMFCVAKVDLRYDKSSNSFEPYGEVTLTEYSDEMYDITHDKRIYKENWDNLYK